MMKMRINFEDLKMVCLLIATARILVSIFAVSRFLSWPVLRSAGQLLGPFGRVPSPIRAIE